MNDSQKWEVGKKDLSHFTRGKTEARTAQCTHGPWLTSVLVHNTALFCSTCFFSTLITIIPES